MGIAPFDGLPSNIASPFPLVDDHSTNSTKKNVIFFIASHQFPVQKASVQVTLESIGTIKFPANRDPSPNYRSVCHSINIPIIFHSFSFFQFSWESRSPQAKNRWIRRSRSWRRCSITWKEIKIRGSIKRERIHWDRSGGLNLTKHFQNFNQNYNNLTINKNNINNNLRITKKNNKQQNDFFRKHISNQPKCFVIYSIQTTMFSLKWYDLITTTTKFQSKNKEENFQKENQ